MSRFFSRKYTGLTPYTPGEQPKDQQYVKLNTNESPFPPSPKAQAYAKAAAEDLQLYSDPECRDLRKAVADKYGLRSEHLLCGNGAADLIYSYFPTSLKQ